jgi:hypothetical protein
VVAAALRAAQNFEAGAEGTVAAGIGGAIDADDRTNEGAGKMQRAGISSDDERDATGKSNQLGQRAADMGGSASGCARDGIRERIFAGTGVDKDAESAMD